MPPCGVLWGFRGLVWREDAGKWPLRLKFTWGIRALKFESLRKEPFLFLGQAEEVHTPRNSSARTGFRRSINIFCSLLMEEVLVWRVAWGSNNAGQYNENPAWTNDSSPLHCFWYQHEIDQQVMWTNSSSRPLISCRYHTARSMWGSTAGTQMIHPTSKKDINCQVPNGFRCGTQVSRKAQAISRDRNTRDTILHFIARNRSHGSRRTRRPPPRTRSWNSSFDRCGWCWSPSSPWKSWYFSTSSRHWKKFRCAPCSSAFEEPERSSQLASMEERLNAIYYMHWYCSRWSMGKVLFVCLNFLLTT
jgi:hypothetical protein